MITDMLGTILIPGDVCVVGSGASFLVIAVVANIGPKTIRLKNVDYCGNTVIRHSKSRQNILKLSSSMINRLPEDTKEKLHKIWAQDK